MADCRCEGASKARRAACPNVQINNSRCPCESVSCERHGVCCECIEYHRTRGGKPACLK